MLDLNPKLKDLLMREAHLRLYRERLEPAWSRKEATLRALESTRPRFIPIVSWRKRAEYEKQLAAARQAAAQLRSGMAVIDRVEPQVKSLILAEIEAHLGEHDFAFGRAREARGVKRRWMETVDRFAAKVESLLIALENLRQGARGSDVGELFRLAVEAAGAVTGEARAANQLAAGQTRLFLASGLAVRPLPRLPETDLAAGLQRARALTTTEAATQLARLAEQMEKLCASGIAELRAQGESVSEMQEAEVHALLLVAWEQLRAEVAAEVFAGDTEHVVNETAGMALAAAG